MGIKLDDIKDRSALTLLKDYKGKNPYIQKLQKEYKKKGKIRLTENQSKYIINNFNKEPLKINRIIEISDYFAGELQKKENLTFLPKRILIYYILGETEKTFHIYGKLKKNQKKSKMYWIPKTQLFDDPYFEPINIDVDFDKYIKLDTLHRTPYDHQKTGIKFLLSRNGAILGDGMGLGKAQPLDSKILTPNGWCSMGDIKINDEVIGSDGKPTKVTGVFPQGVKDIYKITFTDGSTVECCDEHLWAVQTPTQKHMGSGYQVKTLKDIMLDIKQSKSKNLRWYIPIIKPVQFNESEPLSLDPYIMGCLLGGGGFSGHNIKFYNIDKEIISEISGRLPNTHELKHINGCEYQLIGVNNHNKIIRELKNYNLMGLTSENKSIPNHYKYSGLVNRQELLQGLMDTDGYIAKDGTIQFYSTSKQLSNDVKELIQSFGGVARETSKIGKYKLPDGTIKECKECFILTINLPENIIPFKLQRKVDRLKTNKKYYPSRGIKSVELSRTTEAQCISVGANDSLYVTDNYIITHNTYQAIIAALESDAEKILVVCPASVKINWEREINYFCDHTSIISGRKWNPDKFTIINYDILKNFHTLGKKKKKNKPEDDVIEYNRELINHGFDLVIVDEAHYLKNPKSNRGKIMVELCVKHGIEKVWLLTGTPITNRPMDYYNLLKLIKAPVADNWVFFAKRYCAAKKFFKTLKNGRKKQIWLTDGASNLDELANKTKNQIIRRKKEEVLDMPDKTTIPMLYTLNTKQRYDYENLWEDYIEKRREEGKRGNPQKDLVELILLRKYIAMSAIPHTIELAENAINQDEKVIIFTTFTDELMELHEHFGDESVIHYGPMNPTEKQESIDRFMKNDKVKVFIGNIKSAGVGITLTSASVTIFNSFSWVPGENEQAEDRSHRIGQENNVTIYYQLFKDSISIRMWSTLQNKKEIISKILKDDDLKIKSKEEEEIINYIEQLKGYNYE